MLFVCLFDLVFLMSVEGVLCVCVCLLQRLNVNSNADNYILVSVNILLHVYVLCIITFVDCVR